MKKLLIILTFLAWLPSAHANKAEYDLGNYAFSVGDYEKAFKILKPLAEKGYAPAQYGVGFLYFSGFGVSEDKDEAKKWFEKAAAQGNGHAKYFLDNYLE